MSCDISRGRLEPCKDSVGGLNAVYFVNKGDLDAVTYDVTDTDVIDCCSELLLLINLILKVVLHIQKTLPLQERMELLPLSKF